MSDKPNVRIENWQRTAFNTLYGEVADHPRFDAGTIVHTSLILEPAPDADLAEGDVVETMNTRYTLGVKKAKVFTNG